MLLSWIFVLTAPSHACAGLAHGLGVEAEAEASELILELDGTSTRATYRLRYTGDAADFGWVIPVPGTVEEVLEGDPSRFDALHTATDPIVSELSAGGGGCAGPGLAKGADNAGVDVLSEGFAGAYEYAILDADDGQSLGTWLADQQFEAGIETATIDRYIDEGQVFVAVRLQPDAVLSADASGFLPPIAITYTGPLAFPARMAQPYDDNVFRTTVWVLGDQTASVQGWDAIPAGRVPVDDAPSAAAAWSTFLTRVGGTTSGFAITFAGPVDDVTVTRFDAEVFAEAHTSDPTFVIDGATAPTQTRLEVWAGFFLLLAARRRERTCPAS